MYLGQIGFMLYWGFFAFQLEFYGTNFFSELHWVNSGFFVINCLSMCVVARYHQPTITYELEGENVIKKAEDKVSESKVTEAASASDTKVKKS